MNYNGWQFCSKSSPATILLGLKSEWGLIASQGSDDFVSTLADKCRSMYSM